MSSSGTPGVSFEWFMSDNADAGTGRSNASGDPDWPIFGDPSRTWYTMLEWWGADFNFAIDANLCKDLFSLCSIQPGCNVGLAFFWRLPDAFGDVANAQKIPSKGGECRVQEVNGLLHWAGS